MYEGERAFLKALTKTQWAPRAELTAYQDRLIERLCRHAALQCDAYRPRLRRLFTSGDAARGRFQRANWDRVPILTRVEAAALGDALDARATPPEAGITVDVFTSGTTGRPLALKKSSLVHTAGFALFARLLQTWGLAADRSLCSIGPDPESRALPPEGFSKPGWNILSPGAMHHQLSFAASIYDTTDWLLRRRPTYLSAYPNTVRALIEEIDRREASLALEAVFTTGETLAADLQEAIRLRFGARHIDTYGLREVGEIAQACPVSGMKHLNAETVLAEIVRADGSPCDPGETGRVVVTPFYNYATPLIRYDTGDLAVNGPPTCTCGRTLPLIERVIGRARQLFRFPDGTVRAPVGINRLARHISYRQSQLVQVEGWRIEFRYVPDQPFDEDARQTALQLLKTITHAQADIHLVPVEAIPRGEGGKLEDSVSLVSVAPNEAGAPLRG